MIAKRIFYKLKIKLMNNYSSQSFKKHNAIAGISAIGLATGYGVYRIFKTPDSRSKTINRHLLLGDLNAEKMNFEKAYLQYEKCRELTEESIFLGEEDFLDDDLKKIAFLASIYNKLALIDAKNKNFDQSIIYFKKSIQFASIVFGDRSSELLPLISSYANTIILYKPKLSSKNSLKSNTNIKNESLNNNKNESSNKSSNTNKNNSLNESLKNRLQNKNTALKLLKCAYKMSYENPPDFEIDQINFEPLDAIISERKNLFEEKWLSRLTDRPSVNSKVTDEIFVEKIRYGLVEKIRELNCVLGVDFDEKNFFWLEKQFEHSKNGFNQDNPKRLQTESDFAIALLKKGEKEKAKKIVKEMENGIKMANFILPDELKKF